MAGALCTNRRTTRTTLHATSQRRGQGWMRRSLAYGSQARCCCQARTVKSTASASDDRNKREPRKHTRNATAKFVDFAQQALHDSDVRWPAMPRTHAANEAVGLNAGEVNAHRQQTRRLRNFIDSNQQRNVGMKSARMRNWRAAPDPDDEANDDDDVNADIPTAVRRSGGSGTTTTNGGRKDNVITLYAGVGVALCAAAWAAAASRGPSRMPTAVATANAGATAREVSDELYGHRAYAECPRSELRAVSGGYGDVTLRAAAARQFEAMRAHAARDGVYLVPVSGFRSVDEQHDLYFNVKSLRVQTAAQRAEVSAPPGYSEHHTGYAVDVAEEGRVTLTEDFKYTRAFHWLCNHAAKYHFELSFPENNEQGVAFEPWHWRWTGDVHALRTFARGGR
ncbi:D-alanyl-D-alanine carboxypeptidase [Pycnococcus provasolii]